MKSSKAGTIRRVAPIHALLGAATLGLLVMPIAFAGAKPTAQASKSNLRRQIKALNRRVSALESKAPPAQTIPATLPPSGPAGGVLTGTFPNPSGLAPDSVSSAQILDHSVDQADLGGGIVGAHELKSTYERVSEGTRVAANTFGDATASCNPGDHVLGGGYAWERGNVVPSPDFVSTGTVFSTPNVSGGGFDNPDQWIVEASPPLDNTLFAWAVCLRV